MLLKSMMKLYFFERNKWDMSMKGARQQYRHGCARMHTLIFLSQINCNRCIRLDSLVRSGRARVPMGGGWMGYLHMGLMILPTLL
jgi:hypothetical protein